LISKIFANDQLNNDDTTYKSVFITLVMLSIPTILEEIMSTLVLYVDTAMVGRLGEKATAAVSTTMTINWLLHSVAGAIGVAVLALSAHAMGAGDNDRLKRISGQAIYMSLICGIILEIAAIMLSPYIPVWMGSEVDIRHDASMYFTIISTVLIFRTSGRVFAASIRATKDTKTPMMITVVENILNVILNTLFIYVLSMGVQGAAIASAISYGIGGILLYIAYRKNDYLRCPLAYIKPDKSILKECVSIGFPALLTNVASCMGYVVFAGLVSSMGTRVFAAHSIAVSAEEIVYIPGYGIRVATSSLVGNALGEGNIKKLKMTEQISIIVTVIIMCINGALLFAFAYPFMSIFTSSEAVALLGSRMLKMVALSEPFFGLMIVVEGISYGLGRTKNVLWIETFSMWGIRILFTFIVVKILHLSLEYVWMCMIADNVFKAVFLSLSHIKYSKKRNTIICTSN